jgi:hypothetical protein
MTPVRVGMVARFMYTIRLAAWRWQMKLVVQLHDEIGRLRVDFFEPFKSRDPGTIQAIWKAALREEVQLSTIFGRITVSREVVEYIIREIRANRAIRNSTTFVRIPINPRKPNRQ